MKKYILPWIIVCFAQWLSAQSLHLNGQLVIDDATTEGARLIISRNGIVLETKEFGRRGGFSLKLGLDADYKLLFEKDGYITKSVGLNTEVPEEVIENNPNFPPVKLIINLLPRVDGVDLSIFEQPVSIWVYDYDLDDFMYDKEYASKIKDRVTKTEQEIKRILARRGSEGLLNEQLFAGLVGKGERAFGEHHWKEAAEHWTAALKLKPGKKELEEKIAIAQREQEREEIEKNTALQNARKYKMLVAAGDSLFAARKYAAAREKFVLAQSLPLADAYPRERIAKVEQILRMQADEAERKREEEKRIAERMARYERIVGEADEAFKTENYAVARTLYTEADQLQTDEVYPKNKIKAIDNILNSGKYKQRVAEFVHNREVAEKELSAKNYAGAKVYYEKAASTLPIDKEEIQAKIAEIDKFIEAEQSELRKKEYQEQIERADKAWEEKSYAVAKFYYQKALEVKQDDRYAQEKLGEIEKLIDEKTKGTNGH